MAIAPETVLGHTDEFREAAKSRRGDEVVVLGAKGLALTGLDFATDEPLRLAVREEFEKNVVPYRK